MVNHRHSTAVDISKVLIEPRNIVSDISSESEISMWSSVLNVCRGAKSSSSVTVSTGEMVVGAAVGVAGEGADFEIVVSDGCAEEADVVDGDVADIVEATLNKGDEEDGEDEENLIELHLVG
jgi:hypothetical protein